MQYSVAFLAALVASTAAFPWGGNGNGNNKDTTIHVTLQNQRIELGSGTTFNGDETKRQESAPNGSDGPFETVNIDLGKDIKNKDLRCQILDHAGKPIIATRGENTDITFSDADKNEWTFKKPSKVSKIICDPAFKKAKPEDLEVKVILRNDDPKLELTVGGFSGDERVKKHINTGKEYNSIEIAVGALVANDKIRCLVKDGHHKRITALRGTNVDTTFSDADKGKWDFIKADGSKTKIESKVTKIICDPGFKSANPPAAPPAN